MKKKLLLLDFNSLFYRGLHVNQYMQFRGGFTGGIFGFVNQVAATINEVSPDIIIVCDDSFPYKRSKVFPGYKADRKKTRSPEDQKVIAKNIDTCRDFLDEAGIPIVARNGLEADDIFALIVKRYHMEFNMVIASSDTDLYQLLDHAIMYKGKKGGYYDKRMFFRDYQYLKKPKDWAMVLAIAGSHNGTPKVKAKVGPKTAIKLLHMRSHKKEKDELFEKYGEKIKRNHGLCVLPFPGSKPILYLPRNIRPNEQNLIRFLSHYGIQYTANFSRAFVRDQA